MSEAFLGEVRIFAGDFAPRGWALCNGQLMSVQQNTALFSILGVAYGGDGRTTFGLPNLMGRAPMHAGSGPGLTNRNVGQTGGSSTVTLLTSHMPAHNHVPMGDDTSNSATSTVPKEHNWGSSSSRGGAPLYTNDPGRVQMSANALEPAGLNHPHNNMQPYLGMTFIIAVDGIFPPRP